MLIRSTSSDPVLEIQEQPPIRGFCASEIGINTGLLQKQWGWEQLLYPGLELRHLLTVGG